MNSQLEQKGKRYRPSLEIARDMLYVASAKVRKTRMMYAANLSYRQSEKYLKNLLDNGLLECQDDSCYLITKRGKDFLQMYIEYIERSRRIDEEISGALTDRFVLENMCFNGEANLKRTERKKVLG